MSVRTPLCAIFCGLVVMDLASCFPIPRFPGDTSETRLNISSVAPESIMVGKTTRADVLLALGEPDGASEHGEQFIYTRATSKGGIFGLLIGPQVGWAGTERMVYRRLIITFDDQGVVASKRMESAACWESSLQETSSLPCVDVQGLDVTSLDILRTEEVSEVRAFPRLYWYPGIHGFQSFRGFTNFFSDKGLDEFRRHTPGILVVGESHVYFFPPNADRETAPILKLSYDEIAEVFLDRFLGGGTLMCVVLKRNNGTYESFGVWDPSIGNTADPKSVESAGRLIESKWKAATARH